MSATTDMSLELSSSSTKREMQTSLMIQLVCSDYCSIPLLRIPKKPHITMRSFEELIKPTPFNTELKSKQISKSSDFDMGLSIKRRAESSSPVVEKKKALRGSLGQRLRNNCLGFQSLTTPKSRFSEGNTRC